MKSTAVHPADAIDAARVASAACYVAIIFIGTGRFDRAAHATLAHAKETAGLMEAHYRNGRRAMIYAVLPCGAAVLVLDAQSGSHTMAVDGRANPARVALAREDRIEPCPDTK